MEDGVLHENCHRKKQVVDLPADLAVRRLFDSPAANQHTYRAPLQLGPTHTDGRLLLAAGAEATNPHTKAIVLFLICASHILVFVSHVDTIFFVNYLFGIKYKK
jgi:hypothetical protein